MYKIMLCVSFTEEFSKKPVCKKIATIGAMLLVVVFALSWRFFVSTPVPHLSSLPSMTSFVGREQDISVLQPVLEFSSTTPKIVSITGGPGFGKSTLAIFMGHKLKDKGIHVVYIDMAEVSSMHTLAFKVLRISQNSLSRQNITIQDVYDWSSFLKHETLLILDNCDDQFHSNKDDLQRTIEKLTRQSKHMNLKILTTSRQHVAYIERSHPHVISELPVLHACKLLLDLTDSLDHVTCEKVANITGSVPLALRVIGALLNMPNPPRPKEILSKLQTNLLGTLSPVDLKTEDRVNASIYLSYKYLEIKKIGRYLSYFPGSFEVDAAVEILSELNSASNSIHDHLQTLVKRSLLDHNRDTDRYVYHVLIREFFRSRSTPEEARQFNKAYMNYYVSVLEKIKDGTFLRAAYKFLINKHDFQHFFDLLSNSSNERFNVMFVKIADNFLSGSEHNFLHYGFSKLEVKAMIQGFLSCMKQIRKQIRLNLGEEQFVKVYSSMVVHLSTIEQLLSSDAATKIAATKAYWWIFYKHGQQIRDQEYIQFYIVLAEWYEDLKEDNKARKCHERVLQREKVLSECKEECNNLDIAKAFASVSDYERSVFYCDQALKNLASVSPLNLPEIIEAADALLQLFDIYSKTNTYSSIDEVATKLSGLIDRLIRHNPVLIFKSNRTTNIVVEMIHLLESTGRLAEAKQLQDYFNMGLARVHLSCEIVHDLKHVLDHLVHNNRYTATTSDYRVAVAMGQRLIEHLKYKHDDTITWPMNLIMPIGIYSGCETGVVVPFTILLNLRKSYFNLGDNTEAIICYAKAAKHLLATGCVVIFVLPIFYIYQGLPTAFNKFVNCLLLSPSCAYFPSTFVDKTNYQHFHETTELVPFTSTAVSVYSTRHVLTEPPSEDAPNRVDVFMNYLLSFSIVKHGSSIFASSFILLLCLCCPCILQCCHCRFSTIAELCSVVFFLFLISWCLSFFEYLLCFHIVSVAMGGYSLLATLCTCILFVKGTMRFLFNVFRIVTNKLVNFFVFCT